tara:strand:- start:85 stop:1185 length:1101 start_codon:yes stop_codon:yes gene_type:complete
MTDTIKIIESQQVFAKNVYLDFMSKRFGITPCCITDSISSNIKKQLCDWKSLHKDIPEIQSIASEIFYPASPIHPCDDPLAPEWCKICGYYEPENYKDLQEQLITLNNQIDELCVTKENTIVNIQKTKDSIELLEIKIEKINASILELNEILSTIEEELDELIVKYKAECDTGEPITTECEDLAIQIKVLQKQADSIVTDIEILQKELSGIEEELLSFQNILIKLELDLADLNIKIDDKMQQIRDIEALFCDDSECITISVIDQHGDPVENYEVIIDGGNTGLTDYNGILYHIVPNASKNTDHTLQICYCFDTEGACRQQKITIEINTGKDKEDCVPHKNCEDIKITKTIIGTPPTPCEEDKSTPE